MTLKQFLSLLVTDTKLSISIIRKETPDIEVVHTTYSASAGDMPEELAKLMDLCVGSIAPCGLNDLILGIHESTEDELA